MAPAVFAFRNSVTPRLLSRPFSLISFMACTALFCCAIISLLGVEPAGAQPADDGGFAATAEPAQAAGGGQARPDAEAPIEAPVEAAGPAPSAAPDSQPKAGPRSGGGPAQKTVGRAAVQKKPDISWQKKQAQKFLTEQKYEEAAKKFEVVVRFRPRDTESLAALGKCYLHSGRFEEARQVLLRAQRLNENLAPVHYNLAILNTATDDIRQALFSLERAVSLDPSLAQGAGNDPDLARLRSYPRFWGILKEARRP